MLYILIQSIKTFTCLLAQFQWLSQNEIQLLKREFNSMSSKLISPKLVTVSHF